MWGRARAVQSEIKERPALRSPFLVCERPSLLPRADRARPTRASSLVVVVRARNFKLHLGAVPEIEDLHPARRRAARRGAVLTTSRLTKTADGGGGFSAPSSAGTGTSGPLPAATATNLRRVATRGEISSAAAGASACVARSHAHGAIIPANAPSRRASRATTRARGDPSQG